MKLIGITCIGCIGITLWLSSFIDNSLISIVLVANQKGRLVRCKREISIGNVRVTDVRNLYQIGGIQ